MTDQEIESDLSAVAARTALLLIAHGSRQQAANDDLHHLADRFAAGGTYPIVEACFLELAEPDIPTGGARCVARCDPGADDPLLPFGRCASRARSH